MTGRRPPRRGRGLDAGSGRRTLRERHGLGQGQVMGCGRVRGIGVRGRGGRLALPRSARRLWSRRHDDRWVVRWWCSRASLLGPSVPVMPGWRQASCGAPATGVGREDAAIPAGPAARGCTLGVTPMPGPAHAGMIFSATYGLPDHGSLWRQMAELGTTIPRAPYAPRACSAGRVPADSDGMRECTPEPCAQVRILLGAHKSNTQANRTLWVICDLTWANVPA